MTKRTLLEHLIMKPFIHRSLKPGSPSFGRSLWLGWLAALGGVTLAVPGLAVERQVLSGHVPALAARSAPLGRLPVDQRLKLAIGLPVRNQPELKLLLEQLYDPASLAYHHYLTAQEFAERFGPREQDYQAVMDFAQASGLKITATSPNRVLLNVEGAVADIEQAFHFTLRVYQHPKEARTFYAPDAEPALDLAVPVLRIAGLDNSVLPHPKNLKRLPPAKPGDASPRGGAKGGSGPGGSYMGNDFRAAYVPGTSLTGAGQVLALFEMDGYFPTDIATYETMNGLPSVPLQNVLLDGFNGAPGGGNGEVALDIEVAIAMAPGLAEIILYEGAIPESICNQIATDNLASQISCSWGWMGGPNTVLDQIFQQMAAQGQTFFDASGDVDAFPPGAVDDPSTFNAPSDDPYIIQVGGTTLTTTGPGGAWVSETVWQWGGGVGSSGGISSYYTLPIWQQGVNMSTNGGSTTFRNLPDVALTADNILIVADDGQLEPGTGGTSCAAPLWAAFTALVNQQAVENGEQPVGFINPAIYAIAKKPALYAQAFHDVVTGNNTNDVSTNLFFAVPGYDLCTGWGTPNGTNLIDLLAPPLGLVPLLNYMTNFLLGGNGNGVIDPDECNSMYIALTNFGGAIATGVRATLSTTTPGVIIAQPSSLYPTMPTNSAATNLVPFLISTARTFPCGTPVNFMLTVASAQSFNSARFRFQLPSGLPALPLRYDNSTPAPVPVNSTVVVSNFPSAVTKATVSLYIADFYDADLSLELVAPDGTTETLSANNGGFGQNYGLACTPDAARTTFDDSASLQIGAGVAPFAGPYRPDKPLSVFSGKAGTNVNGVWTLRASHQIAGDLGTLYCWSLFLTPANCTDGIGECPGADMAVGLTTAPDPVIIGDLLTYSISVTNNGPSSTESAAVTLLLPSDVQFVTAKLSQGNWNLSSDGSILTCTLGPMAGQTAASIAVTCQVPLTLLLPSATNVVCSATVSSDQPDPNPANNSATVVNHIHPLTADLAVKLTASPTSPLVDGTLTYTLTAVNNGPSTATGVVVTNILPATANLPPTYTVSQGSASCAGNVLVYTFGTLTNSAVATATVVVSIGAAGDATATATVLGQQGDPDLANNTATLTTSVGPAADLSVSVAAVPNPVVLRSNLTYSITVANNGPSVASSVVLTHVMDPSLTVISTTKSQGSLSLQGATIVANLGSLSGRGSALVTATVSPSIQGPIKTTSSVIGAQPDPNPANNSVTTTVQVSPPFISIVAAGATLTSESFSPPNGAIDNGETVTVNFLLRNAGNVPNTNLQATLLATNGILPSSPQTQSYGVLNPSGAPVGEPFTFTANGVAGSTITAVLQLQDGLNVLTNLVTYNFVLPSVRTFPKTNVIVIVDLNRASPYPSTNVVSGLAGTLSKVTATLSGFSHGYPRDVDVLLVAPTGAKTLLLSHAGNQPASNLNLTFDDTASSTLPFFGPFLSGSWLPSAYSPAPLFSNAAPAGPYATALSGLNGINPNGNWLLYVEDDKAGDFGGISNGWSLTLTAITPVNPLADLALTVAGPPSPSLVSGNLAYAFVITNGGPATATDVVFTNVLPPNVAFVSAASSQGTIGLSDGMVIGNLGAISAGSTAAVSVVFAPSAAAVGLLTNTAVVGSPENDLNPANNIASAVVRLGLPVADLVLAQSASPDPVVVGYFLTNTISVTNNGPNQAIGVVLTDPLPTNATFIAATSTLGSCVTNDGILTCSFGDLAPNANALVTLVLSPLAAFPVTNGLATNQPLLSMPSVSTLSTDTNLSNNTASNLFKVNNPAPFLKPAGAALLSESGPINGALDPDETVTVSFALTNAGTADTTTNLTATLTNSGGLIATSSVPQVYGVIVHGGPPVAKPFTFTVKPASLLLTLGGAVTATLQLQDVRSFASGLTVTNYYTNSFIFGLPSKATFLNTNNIVIPDVGPASPYPSTITVSNLTGLLSKATVTFPSLSHSFPSDINALLVSPRGGSVLLMAHAGASYSLNGVTLVFDDAGPPLPLAAPIHNSTYQPTAYGPIQLPPPAPPLPYGSTLASLNGWDPNGVWSLYVLDDKVGDDGLISGWSLDLTTVHPLNPASADVGLTATSPALVAPASSLTSSLTVFNSGPDNATGVTITSLLPAGVVFASAASSEGGYSLTNGTVTFQLGNLNAGAVATASLSVIPGVPGLLTNSFLVAASQTDLDLGNNSVQTVTTVLGLTISRLANGQYQVALNGAPGQSYVLQSCPDLVSWTSLSTNTAVAGSPIIFPINPATTGYTFYRAIPAP